MTAELIVERMENATNYQLGNWRGFVVPWLPESADKKWKVRIYTAAGSYKRKTEFRRTRAGAESRCERLITRASDATEHERAFA